MERDTHHIEEQLAEINAGIGTKLDVNIYLDNQPIAAQGNIITETLIDKLATMDSSRLRFSREKLIYENGELADFVDNTIRPHAADIAVEAGVAQDLTEEARQMATRKVKEIFESCRYLTKLDLSSISELAGSLINRITSLDAAAFKLHDLRNYDEYTYYHSVNVCVLGTALFRDQINNDDELLNLGIGLLLHDIGKSKIDLKILNKPAALTDDEFTMMKRHVMYGYNLVKGNNNIAPMAKELILNHHERINGTGYTRGLTESQLSYFDMVAGICDVFDAITTDRVYRRKLDIHRAVSILLRGSGTHFQTKLVNLFLRGIGRFPVGTFVLLSNGEIGVVSKVNRDALSLPTIRVVFDAYGSKLTHPRNLDLYKQRELYVDRPLDLSYSPVMHSRVDTNPAH